jgi:drug/metabolite transporter (DMT)-like permease
VLERPAQPAFPHLLLRRMLDFWNGLSGNVKGGILMLLTGLLACFTQAMLKVVGQRLPITEFIVLRQVMMFVLLLPMIVANPSAMKSTRVGSQIMRVALAIGGMYFTFHAVVNMPLADATAVDFSKAFIVTILAIMFLGEKIGPRRWAATFVGFVGVLIMVRPGTSGFNVYALYALAGAACWAAMPIIVRRVRAAEQPLTMMIYQVFFTGIVLVPLCVYWWVPPTPFEWLLLFAVAALSVAIQFGGIFAWRFGEPGALAPLDYTRLLFSGILGVMIFSEWPTIYTILGALLILGASVYTMGREQRRGRPPVAAEAEIKS